jgi:plasmid maintenance system antidote protein VapI
MTAADLINDIVRSALHVEEDTIAKVARGKRPVTARLAIRVARLIEVRVDDLLAGQHISAPARTAASARGLRR